MHSLSDPRTKLSRGRMHRIGDRRRCRGFCDPSPELPRCRMYGLGDVSSKLPGSGVNSISDACAELSGSRMHRIRNIGIELARWLSGRRRRGLSGRGRFLAKIALRGEFPPVSYGKRGRLLCHDLSSILIFASLSLNFGWNIQHGYRRTGAKQRQLALQRFDTDETECQCSSHAW